MLCVWVARHDLGVVGTLVLSNAHDKKDYDIPPCCLGRKVHLP